MSGVGLGRVVEKGEVEKKRKMSHFRCFICRFKTESGFVNGSVVSTKYRQSLIPSGGLEIPLLLKLSCPEQKTFEKIKNFVDSLYDCDCSGINDDESSDGEEAEITIETDQSNLVSYTDSSSKEEEEADL